MSVKYIVYWGRGLSRICLDFNANDPAREFYEALLSDPMPALDIELIEQTPQDFAANDVIHLSDLIDGYRKERLPTDKDDVLRLMDNMMQGIVACQRIAERLRTGVS